MKKRKKRAICKPASENTLASTEACERRRGSYKLTTHKKVGERQDTRKPTRRSSEGWELPREETREKQSVSPCQQLMYSVWESVGTAEVTQRSRGDGRLTLLLPSLSGCGGFSITT